ncbi:hypothetical protein WCY_02549 [Escherichia coli KTE16]|uniref:hypothetical protein n=1 Tax=Escherichia coli TaxID=562 RepID=UPI0002A1DC19|nr:hypothetical protein [Escherichia coli]ELC28199.1 hypothetical protein WCY_02549 [Escherichia coli KTE16]
MKTEKAKTQLRIMLAGPAAMYMTHAPAIKKVLDELDVRDKRIEELEAQSLQSEGVQFIAEAIGAHAYIVGCLQQNRPDLALEESLKWVQVVGCAAGIRIKGE